MNDEQPRPRRRRQTTGEQHGRLSVEVEQGIITALALEAQRRGVTLSQLTRIALSDWMRRELPLGAMPHEAQTPESRKADGRCRSSPGAARCAAR
jgi:hypothetical protein